MKTVCASSFKWNDGFGVANASDLGMARAINELLVKSPKTDKVLKFSLDIEEAVANESWDGEFVILYSKDKKIAVKIWNY
jgi:hypothetical protein